MNVIFLDPAEQEMNDAADYYEDQSPALGIDFLREVQKAVRQILDYPMSSPIKRDDVRVRFLNRFPYGVLYRIHHETIVIIAVMHQHRRPDYWIDRL